MTEFPTDVIVWAAGKRLPAPQRSTLMALARRYPLLETTHDQLAHEAGLSIGGIKLSIKALQKTGLLQVERIPSRANLYVLNLGCKAYDL